MKELRIDDQYSIWYRPVGLTKMMVELHDFHNLMMFKDTVSIEEYLDMRLNPSKYI